MPSRRSLDRASRVDLTAHTVSYGSSCTRCRTRHVSCRRSPSSSRCVDCIRSASLCLYPSSRLNASRTRAALRNIRSHVRHIDELLSILDADSSSDDNALGVLPESSTRLSTSPVLASPTVASPNLASTVLNDPSDSSLAVDVASDLASPVAGLPSVDLNSIDWTQFIDFQPGDVPGSIFAFDDLYPSGFVPDSLPSLIDDTSSSSSSGFLGSGAFLEYVDPRSL